MFPRSKKKLCRGIELCLFTAWIKEKKNLFIVQQKYVVVILGILCLCYSGSQEASVCLLGQTQSCLWRRADFIPESSFFTFLAEDRKKTDES